MKRKIIIRLSQIITIFEFLISVFLLIAIVISIPDIIKYYFGIINTGSTEGLIVFKEFLSHILLLVIAMEFVLLLFAHTDSIIIHIILILVSRKMLIHSESAVDLLLGVIAISLLFLIRKYLIGNFSGHILGNYLDMFSASQKIDDINRIYKLNIKSRGYQTLGGLVSNLIKQKGLELSTGVIVDDDQYIYEVQKESNNVIEVISIDKSFKNK